MEALNVLVFLGAWILLGVLANRYGHDSRDGFSDRPAGPLWHLPGNDGPDPPEGGRRLWALGVHRAARESMVSRVGAAPGPSACSISMVDDGAGMPGGSVAGAV
jgi:hypothetical protein